MDLQPVTFCKLGDLKSGEKFVMDLDDIHNEVEHDQLLGFAYDGFAMISNQRTGFVRGFKSGLTKNSSVIKLSH